MAFETMVSLPSAARASYSSGPLSTGGAASAVLNLDVSVTALTGGTSPNVKFTVSRIESDGVLYPIYNPTPITGPGTFSQSIGTFYQTPADLGDNYQIDMVGGGTVPPTSVTFSLTAKVRTT